MTARGSGFFFALQHGTGASGQLQVGQRCASSRAAQAGQGAAQCDSAAQRQLNAHRCPKLGVRCQPSGLGLQHAVRPVQQRGRFPFAKAGQRQHPGSAQARRSGGIAPALQQRATGKVLLQSIERKRFIELIELAHALQLKLQTVAQEHFHRLAQQALQINQGQALRWQRQGGLFRCHCQCF
ncbi:hypothetical protein GALL_455660 [mine drainage metagenome]|uniref:Uncharacterized protein n=1 Tax=mine drainage metagenome TaxID=410659 RepID=A0A1J5PYY7_9ZZZZ